MHTTSNHDNQADKYDSFVKRDAQNKNNYVRENYFELHDRVIELLELSQEDHLLDIGIGTGLLEEKIFENMRIDKKEICSITGIDLSGKMLEKAGEKDLNIDLKQGSFLDIPFPDNTFSRIVSCFAFHHLDQEEKISALREMKRVLTKDGKIVIGDFMYKDAGAYEALKKKFTEEGREDMVKEIEEEYLTDIEWLKQLPENLSCKVDCEQISTLSWVVSISG